MSYEQHEWLVLNEPTLAAAFRASGLTLRAFIQISHGTVQAFHVSHPNKLARCLRPPSADLFRP